MKWKILIIEDDFFFLEQIQNRLQNHYEVYCIREFDHILLDVQSIKPHLILLDINLPGKDGFYWCEQFRSLSNVPILFISARNEIEDTLKAIHLGGDDYLTKPFRIELLEAKIEAALRRNEEYQKPKTIELKNELVYHLDLQMLKYHNEEVDLTPAERKLFHIFINRKGCLVSRTELMLELWETDQFIEEGTLTTLVSRLRQKLKQICGSPLIITAKGKGYYIE
ncbi:response regulator transcription factor [Dubosiella newyorkensis]|mgnify:CR=1 FL=1|uniref:response regulator transcription factor n=1 Tax=Dubosiella newyorkensis TaxID=1862672 RepID=UPI0023F1211C|nr:response regulator transcription factor [Dubosiella newyorkensis]